jgi:hypothetical protein
VGKSNKGQSNDCVPRIRAQQTYFSTMKTILFVTAVGKILPDDHKLTQIGQDVSFHKTTK